MSPRRVVIATVAALALSMPAPALAQDGLPAGLFDAAPAQEPGAVAPTDGGRSLLLLALGLAALAGAAGLAVTAFRGGPREEAARNDVPTGERRRRPRRLRPARAAVMEASAAARRGMPSPIPVAPGPPPERERACWRPRVVSDLPPLPAFGPGSGPPPD
jgi:hypothetical protein